MERDLKPTNDKDVPHSMLIESERLKGSGKGKYKGLKQVGFLHSLATQKLEAYKKEMERKGYTVSEDDPIFIAYRKGKKIKGLSSFSIESNFGKASLRAWHDLEKKRFSPHDFRSFVQTALENGGINSNTIAPLLGHKPRGIDFHYSEHDIEDLLEKYKTALTYLLPQSIEKVKSESDKKISEQNNRIRFLEQKLLDNGLSIDKKLASLENRLTVVEETERKKPEKVKIEG